MIVKPHDYIIGRLKGEFSPGDPAIYRGNLRNQSNFSVNNQPFQTKNHERTNCRIHADVRAHESHPPNSNSMGPGRALDGISETPQWPVNQKTLYTSNQLTELELKLNELKSCCTRTSLRKCCYKYPLQIVFYPIRQRIMLI